MSKEEKPILNLQKGCPFCGNMNLVSEYNPTQNEVKIACRGCNYFITFKVAPPMYVPYLAEKVWNLRADEKKPTAEKTESTAEAILSELKDIKSYVAELLKNYPNAWLDEKGIPKGLCPSMLGLKDLEGCGEKSCVECWNQPMPAEGGEE